MEEQRRTYWLACQIAGLAILSLSACSSGSSASRNANSLDAGNADGADASSASDGDKSSRPTESTDASHEGGTGPVGSGASAAGSVTPEAGGSVTMPSGATIQVPPGAVTTPITITMTETTDPPPAGYTTYSPVFRFEPEGTTFAKPVAVTLPFTGDAKLATLFWSKDAASGTSGWDWVGGSVSQSKASANITHFSKGFVADGVDYDDPPDLSCVSTALLEGRQVDPSGVALFFTAQDCWGRTLTDLTCTASPSSCDFALQEDGASKLSVEAQATILGKDGVEPFATLMLDMSSSTASELSDVIAGAKQFVTTLRVDENLPVQIAVELFDRTTVTTWQEPTLDAALLLSKLDALATYATPDPNGTNLYGAVIEGLASLRSSENDFKARNYGGAFTTGYLVLFTDGGDTAGIFTRAQALQAEAEEVNVIDKPPEPASVQSTGLPNPDQVIAVGLQSPDYDADTLAALAPNAVIAAQVPGNLENAFGALAHRIAGEVQRTYLLGYCTPKAAGTHDVSVEVEGHTNRNVATYTFTATGATGCSKSLFENACQGKQCGGLGCGACDDRTDGCDATSSQCVSFCATQKACGGTVITNPNGYAQTCTDIPQSMSCGGSCVDTTTDSANCGICGHACGNGTCANAACACDPAGPTTSEPTYGANVVPTLCSGACVDIHADNANCGGCGVACDGQCTVGRCATILAQVEGVQTLALDDANIYLRTTSGISKVGKNGGAVTTLVTATLPDPISVGILATGGDVVYTSIVNGNLGVEKIAASGGTPTELARAATSPYGGSFIMSLTSYGDSLYWIDAPADSAATLQRTPLAGGTTMPVASSLTIGTAQGAFLRADAGGIYLAGASNPGPLERFPLGAAASATPTTLAAKVQPTSMWLSSSTLYWTEQAVAGFEVISTSGGTPQVLQTPGIGPTLVNDTSQEDTAIYFRTTNTVQSLPVAGGAPTTLAGFNYSDAVAVDDTSVYWTSQAALADPSTLLKLPK